MNTIDTWTWLTYDWWPSRSCAAIVVYSLCHSRRRKTLDVILLLWLCVVWCVETGIFKTVLHVACTSCCHLVTDLGQLCGCSSTFVLILISFQTFRPTLSHLSHQLNHFLMFCKRTQIEPHWVIVMWASGKLPVTSVTGNFVETSNLPKQNYR